jgi:hypothetical protein
MYHSHPGHLKHKITNKIMPKFTVSYIGKRGDINVIVDSLKTTFYLYGSQAIIHGNKNLPIYLAEMESGYLSEKDFKKNESRHFTIRFKGGENAVAGNLVGILLEEAYLKIGIDFGFYPNDNIEVFLYSQEQFKNITKSPSWAGAVYDGRIKIPIGGITRRTDILEGVLFHEYTHAVVHRLSGGEAPMWLNEGIAQYEEGKRQVVYKDILKTVMKDNKKISLRTLEGSFIGLNREQAYVAYALSLSATEYLIKEFGISVVKYILEGLGEGKAVEEAISSVLYLSYEEFQKNWWLSLKRVMLE